MRTLKLILLFALPVSLGAQEVRPEPVEHRLGHELEMAMARAQLGLAAMGPALAAMGPALDEAGAMLDARAFQMGELHAGLLAGHAGQLAYLERSMAGLETSAVELQARLAEHALEVAVGGGLWIPGRGPDRLPPEPTTAQQQNPADSLYRAARAAMTRGEYRGAAEMFARLVERYQRSTYAGDALYWQAFNLYRVGGERNLGRALRALERQAEAYRDASTRRNREAEQLYTRIRGQLARLGDPDAAAGISEDAQDPCDTPEQELRVAALNALLQMDAERAMPILQGVLERRDECSAELRRKATFLISQHETPAVVDILMEVADNDPDMEVRRQAVFWLSQVEDERAVEALENVLRSATDEELAKRAAFALAQHESARASSALRQAAENAEFSVELRKQVIFWLGQSEEGRRENIQFLRELFGRLDNDELRERVIFAVSQTETEEAGRWLLEIAMDESQNPEIRERALFWAGEAGAPIDLLVELYDRMESPGIKERLIFTYSQREDNAAIEKLIEIAKTEPDQELRKKAIFWLGQSDDPRAAQALLEIISG